MLLKAKHRAQEVRFNKNAISAGAKLLGKDEKMWKLSEEHMRILDEKLAGWSNLSRLMAVRAKRFQKQDTHLAKKAANHSEIMRRYWR